MKQGRTFLAIALTALLAASAVTASRAEAATKSSSAPATAAAKKDYSFRQFTGIVTALDKGTLTVAKSGKQARTVVFARHAEMKVTGDLEKAARVTVYYRDENGQPVARKVVVKAAPLAASR